jgi:hypothetical protein
VGLEKDSSETSRAGVIWCAAASDTSQICQDIVASREDPLSLHLDDQHLNNRLLIEDHNINNNVNHNSSSLGLFSRKN